MYRVAAGLAVLILVICAGRFHYRSGRDAPSGEGRATPLPVIVEVRGDVENAGVHLLRVPDGVATVSQALESAGGLRGSESEEPPSSGLPSSAAAGHGIGIAGLPVHTGELVRAARPRPGDGKPAVTVESMDAAAMLTLGLKLDPNTLTERELSLVPGMKPDFAAYIVQRRQDRQWSNLRELEEIPGVGPKTLDRWKAYLDLPR